MPRDRKSKPPRDYEVGYGKPPTHSRFKPGQSGNPKGRKKGVRNLKGILEEELFRPVSVQVGGKRRTIPILSLVIRQSMAKAVKGGETRALTALIPLIQRAGLIAGDDVAEVVAQSPLSADEEALLMEALAEMKVEIEGGEEDR